MTRSAPRRQAADGGVRDGAGPPAIERAGATVTPLSHAQERMWFADAAAPGNATYNEPLFFAWNEPVDIAALTTALTTIIRRHEILRSTYRLDGDRPVQVVADAASVGAKPGMTDLTGVPDAGRRAREEAEQHAREPFDLETGPIVRCHVWRGIPEGDAVLLTFHHIAVDGGSYPVLLDEFAEAYDSALAGRVPETEDPPVQYADFAAWEREVTVGAALASEVSKRAEELLEVPGGLVLAGCGERPAASEGSRPGRQEAFTVPSHVRERVHEVARSLRATPFVVLLAALQGVLHQWSGRKEFLVGSIVGHRPRPEIEALPGLFVNTVPLRCRVEPQWSFAELCTRSRTEAYRSLSYRELPFDELTSAAASAREQGRRELVDVALVFQNALGSGGRAPTRWAPPRLLGTGTAKFDLLLFVEDGPDGISVTVEHDTDRYSDGIARAIGAGFVALITEAVAGPDRLLRDLPGAPPSGLPLPAPPSPSLSSGVNSENGRSATDPTATASPSGAAPSTGGLTPDERRAAELFADALAAAIPGTPNDLADRLTPEANFFALGGHSLMAVTMLAEARRRYAASVAPRDFLPAPTVSGLARLLGAARAPNDERHAPAAPAIPTGPHPATSAQQRFWFLDRIPELRPAYLMPTVVEYTGPVDRAALHRALTTVMDRHPGLRSRFELDRRQRRLVYRTGGPPPAVAATDAAAWTPAEVREHLASACRTGFDLAVDAPARAEVVSVGDRTLLVLVAHHIAIDGWSRGLLLEQLAEAYRAETGGGPAALAEPVHPARAVGAAPERAVAERTEEMVAWLNGAPTDISLPHDRPRGGSQSIQAATCATRLGGELTARLRAVAGDGLGCTSFMSAVALLAVALARRTGQRDFLFAFPWAGRESSDSADAVAMLVNTLVLRADLRGRITWRDLLERVKESSTFCYRRADVPFESLVTALHPDRDLSRPPLTPVYLTFWDGPPDVPALRPGIGARLLPSDPPRIKYELELDVTEHAEDIELAASYTCALFDPGTVTELLDAMVAAARELVDDPGSHPL